MKWLRANKTFILELMMLALILVVVVFYLFSAFKIGLNVDAAYYLGVVDLISKGYVPIKDFALGYTPLSFFIMLLPNLLIGETSDTTLFFLILYAFSLGTAAFTSAIIYRLTKSRLYSLISFFLTSLFIFHFEGKYYVLEPFSVFFGMWAIYKLYTKKTVPVIDYLLIGFLCGLSFLSKQYGLGFLGVVYLYQFFVHKTWKDRFFSLIYITAGFLFAVLLLFTYLFLNGVGFNSVIQSFAGSGYGERNFNNYFQGLKLLLSLKVFPVLWLVPTVVFYRKSQHYRIILASILGVCLFSFQLYFQHYQHYLIFIIPFVILFSLLLLAETKKVWLKSLLILLIITQSLFSLKSELKFAQSLLKLEPRQAQVQTSEKIINTVAPYSVQTMYAMDVQTIPYYYYLNILPPKMNEYGYSFGFEPILQIEKRVQATDLFLCGENFLEVIKTDNEYKTVIKEIAEKFDRYLLEKESIVVFIRRENKN